MQGEDIIADGAYSFETQEVSFPIKNEPLLQEHLELVFGDLKVVFCFF